MDRSIQSSGSEEWIVIVANGIEALSMRSTKYQLGSMLATLYLLHYVLSVIFRTTLSHTHT